MVWKMVRIREAKNGTQTDELLQAGTDGYPRAWQNVEKEFNSWKMEGFQQRRQETGGLKDKREESQEKNIRGF